MLKILFLLLLVIVALIAWRIAARPHRDRAAPPPEAPPQRMVRCAECSVHLPEAEAVEDAGRYFCDDRHRAAYRRRHAGN